MTEQPTRDLVWHKGRHRGEAHDGYPRHTHSINGALTIVSDDPSPHFEGGAPFTTPNAKAADVARRALAWAGLPPDVLPQPQPDYSRERVVNDAAEGLEEIAAFHRPELSPAERRELADAVAVLRRLRGRISRGEVT